MAKKTIAQRLAAARELKNHAILAVEIGISAPKLVNLISGKDTLEGSDLRIRTAVEKYLTKNNL